MLNHAKGVDADGRGDIPPGWCDSILSGLGSAGPEYMLKYTSLNEPYASVVFQKIELAYLKPGSMLFFALSYSRIIPTRGGLVGAAPRVLRDGAGREWRRSRSRGGESARTFTWR